MKPSSLRDFFIDLVASAPGRVQTKLLVAFLTIAGLLVVVGAVGLRAVSIVNDGTQHIIKLQREIAAYRQIQQDTTSQLYGIATALIFQDNPTLDAALRQLNQFSYDLDRLEFVAKQNANLVKEVRQAYGRMVSSVTRVAELIRNGQSEEAHRVQMAESVPEADRVQRLTNQLVNIAESDMIAAIDSTTRAYRTSQAIVIGFSLVAILLALGLGYVFSQSVVGPVKAIEARLRGIASGDFLQQVEVSNRDELGALAANVNHTSRELGRLSNEAEARTRDLSEALQQQTATADVLKVISRSAFDLKSVLATLVQSAMELCLAAQGTIFLREGDVFRAHASRGGTPELLKLLSENPLRPGPNSVTGGVALSGRVEQTPDRFADPTYKVPGLRDVTTTRAVLGVPLLRDGRVDGVFILSRPDPGYFTARQIELVQTFADQAVIAIENVRLFEEVRARTQELAKSLEDLRSAQDRLVHTEKLASLGQLTAGIAHEIKNPLNFVNNFAVLSAELVDELNESLNEARLDERTSESVNELTGTLKANLQKVVQHGKRADSIVKNMLLHSRAGSGEHRPSDINPILEEALNLAYHGARAENQGFNITMEKSLDPSAGEVDLFPQEITRVLLNLISNGFYAATKRKAQADGGYEPILSASTRNLGESVEIRISDNGTGMTPEVKEKMFNPFFTTKPAGEGTGLGLSLSHDIIVKQHAGTIEVETEPGAFTEFRIVLPRGAASLAKSGGNS